MICSETVVFLRAKDKEEARCLGYLRRVNRSYLSKRTPVEGMGPATVTSHSVPWASRAPEGPEGGSGQIRHTPSL